MLRVKVHTGTTNSGSIMSLVQWLGKGDSTHLRVTTDEVMASASKEVEKTLGLWMHFLVEVALCSGEGSIQLRRPAVRDSKRKKK